MEASITYLNCPDKHPDDEFIMEQYSGHPSDLMARSLEVLFNEGYSHDDLDAGDWIVVIDGELLDDPNEFCPSRIHIEC